MTNFFLPLLFGYAELHYHLKYLFPLYYKSEPEIIADLPRRLDCSFINKLPILIIIKDSHLFPITLNHIEVSLFCKTKKIEKIFQINKLLQTKWYSDIIEIDVKDFPKDTVINVVVKIDIKKKNKKKTIINDNFPGISRSPFQVFLASKALNLPDNWWAGDPHYHSNYTDDQVEFGADIASSQKIAQAMGLSWFFLTDHSYDLDDSLDDCTKNDPKYPKWKMMKRDCEKHDSQNCRVIYGEEVSIGNSRGENVHMLAVHYPTFIDGSGDSAEIWFKNKPQHLLKEIKNLHNESSLFAAAHPIEDVPLAQKLTLRRGNWALEDYHNSGIRVLQLINTDEPASIERAIFKWKEYLLQGEKFYICAGNDAHGNFNIMRQIRLPFLTLWETRKQTFGNWMTIVKNSENDPVSAIKKGKMIVSNGPFISFSLGNGEESVEIGETYNKRYAKLNVITGTTQEFGTIQKINCLIGDCIEGKEIQTAIKDAEIIELPDKGYIRMTIRTVNGFQAYTNPIFIDVKEDI